MLKAVNLGTKVRLADSNNSGYRLFLKDQSLGGWQKREAPANISAYKGLGRGRVTSGTRTHDIQNHNLTL